MMDGMPPDFDMDFMHGMEDMEGMEGMEGYNVKLTEQTQERIADFINDSGSGTTLEELSEQVKQMKSLLKEITENSDGLYMHDDLGGNVQFELDGNGNPMMDENGHPLHLTIRGNANFGGNLGGPFAPGHPDLHSQEQQLTHMDAEGVMGRKPCSKMLGCAECVSNQCAWCLSSRTCKEDKAWMCQGETDHVGLAGIGKHEVCPSLDELDRLKEERKARKEEAQRKLEEEKVTLERKRQELRQRAEAAATSSGIPRPPVNSSDNSDGVEDAPYDKIERYNELRRRCDLADEGHGSKYPYETLEVATTASGGEIRKAYRRLSVAFHPDKNTGDDVKDLADKAFKDIVAAFEIIGNPEKRAIFDDMGGAEKPESFDSQAAYEEYGQKNHDNFYQGHRLIHPLTESLWERRVGSTDTVWLVEFYAPWCSACQSFIQTYKEIADGMEDDFVEVGAVNCVTNERICSDWFGIRAYPTLIALNDKHGTRQEFHGNKDVNTVTNWVRSVAKEWKWLFAQSNIITLEGSEDFQNQVVNSTLFWVIAYMDGVDCSACKTAKTNAMRLSASLRGLTDVQVGIVNCEEDANRELCYGDAGQGIPSRPHAPLLKGYPIGEKAENTRGEVLYNSNEVEPHIALEMLDHTIRLALADRIDMNAIGLHNDGSGYRENDKDEEEKDKKPDRPEPMWNGPKRREPLPWGGGGGQMPNRPGIGF